MDLSFWLEFVRAAVVLLAVTQILDLATARFPMREAPLRQQLAAGVVTGIGAIAVMAVPFELSPGVVFDPRSVLLSVGALFLGPIAAGVALVIAAAFRIQSGGPGALTGVLVIVAAIGIGLLWRRREQDRLDKLGWRSLLMLGIVVHVVMLALMLTLPGGAASNVLPVITVPVMTVFPLATLALGKLMGLRLERERRYMLLEESEARYRALFEQNDAPVLIVDPDGQALIDVNPAAARFYGFPRDEMRRMKLSALAAGPAADPADLPNDPALPQRHRHRLASGEVRSVEMLSGQVMRGTSALTYLIVHDVTAEHDAVQALHLRSAALEAADNAILVTDSSGAIEWVNRSFTKFYGYTFEEAIGRNPRELLRSGAHDAAFYRDMWDTILDGRTWRGRIVNSRKNGTTLEVEMAITAIRGATGAISHFIAVKHDLTEWRAMERRLALGAKLETVGRLAGGVAHDFNNILTIINGALDIALEELPADQVARADIETARNAGERASGLTRQLLAFGRRQVQLRQSLDLNEIVTSMTTMLTRLIGDDIRVDLRLMPQLPPILADPGQMEQVLLNLVLNARDAMPDGGTITVTTRASGADAVELLVADTGHGMTWDVQARIFDPFFTTKSSGNGAGLGLPTVYGIVAQTGGSIHVETAPGRGAAFRVLLPRTDQQPAPRVEAAAAPAPRTTAVILVVEDEDNIRNVAARILQRRGYTVLSCESGEKALKLVAEYAGKIDLLFTDVVMPRMSGPELAMRVLRLRPDIRVMFTSGYTDENLSRHGVHESGHAFLEKPYSVASLTAAVRAALSRHDA